MMLMRMPIGAFSDLVFECSRERVFTLTDYERDAKARYATHDLINQPPALEFIGAGLGEINFTMIFNESLGVDPAEEAQRVRDLCAYGVADYLIIGNEVIGDYMWIIDSVGEEVQAFDGNGQIIVSSINVKLKEYVEVLPQ